MAAWLNPEDYPDHCIDCWELNEQCKCLDLTEYDEIADEIFSKLRRMEAIASEHGLNVRTKYIEQKLAEHRNSVIEQHAYGAYRPRGGGASLC